MGWLKPTYTRKISIIRFWNRLSKLSDDRLTKHIFKWDYCKCSDNWSENVKTIFEECEMSDIFTRKELCNIRLFKENMYKLNQEQWVHDLTSKPKLRTYRLYKSILEPEPYITTFMLKYERSMVAQFRAGVLPLTIKN